jgi:hypothetical protein
MKLGTSVRFLFPTSPATHERFRGLLASMPKGAFIERSMGAYAPDEQARNLMEVASAARAAGLDALLTGDSHAANPGYVLPVAHRRALPCRTPETAEGGRPGRTSRSAGPRQALYEVRKIGEVFTVATCYPKTPPQGRSVANTIDHP